MAGQGMTISQRNDETYANVTNTGDHIDMWWIKIIANPAEVMDARV
jgi:hypothetical protein